MAFRCCYPGCEERMDGTFVACMKHWKLVPEEIRREIQKRRRAWRTQGGERGNVGAAREYTVSWFKSFIRRQTRESIPE
jgi:hypothetical protein